MKLSSSRLLSACGLALGLALAVTPAAAQVPIFARLLRGSMMAESRKDYVLASRSLGLRRRTITMGHVLPNSLGPVLVQATLTLATAIIEVAALSFLGLGAQPPTPEWGSMLSAERNQVFTAPHLVFFPGLAIMLTVLGFNLLGDGLRDALDPRLRR